MFIGIATELVFLDTSSIFIKAFLSRANPISRRFPVSEPAENPNLPKLCFGRKFETCLGLFLFLYRKFKTRSEVRLFSVGSSKLGWNYVYFPVANSKLCFSSYGDLI